MASPKVEQIAPPLKLGEGPHWDHNAQVLYYVDIPASTVNKYDPVTKKQTTAKIDGASVSFIIPIEGKKDQFVVAIKRNIAIMTWDGVSSTPSDVKTVFTLDDNVETEDSFNDGKADPTGRLWTGTASPLSEDGTFGSIGSFYSFDKEWKATRHVTGVSVSNGLAWSKDLKHLYYIDTPKYTVDVFDFDVNTSKISNRCVAFDLKKNGIAGYPDGMTIDTEDNLWVAVFTGSEVIRVDPTNGKLLTRIPIPSPQVTSVAFGGPQLDELYVTTGNIEMFPGGQKPESGATFRITGIGAKGYPGQNIIL